MFFPLAENVSRPPKVFIGVCAWRSNLVYLLILSVVLDEKSSNALFLEIRSNDDDFIPRRKNTLQLYDFSLVSFF